MQRTPEGCKFDHFSGLQGLAEEGEFPGPKGAWESQSQSQQENKETKRNSTNNLKMISMYATAGMDHNPLTGNAGSDDVLRRVAEEIEGIYFRHQHVNVTRRRTSILTRIVDAGVTLRAMSGI